MPSGLPTRRDACVFGCPGASSRPSTHAFSTESATSRGVAHGTVAPRPSGTATGRRLCSTATGSRRSAAVVASARGLCGAIAWTICCTRDGGALWALDAAGLRLIEPGVRPLPTLPPDAPGLRLIDAGPQLELESLELTDPTLTWINGGTRTAVLD